MTSRKTKDEKTAKNTTCEHLVHGHCCLLDYQECSLFLGSAMCKYWGHQEREKKAASAPKNPGK